MPKKHLTPHDRFFKSLMSNPKIAREFLIRNIPQDLQEILDINSIILQPNSFIDDKLRLQITDLLYKIKFKNQPGYLYILVEHQSSQQKLMPFRILKYMAAIMDNHQKTTKSETLPIIYPIIFYSGKKSYNNSTNLFDLFGKHKNLAKKIFLQSYQLINLPEIKDSEFANFSMYNTMAKIMKYIHKYKNNVHILLKKIKFDLKRVAKIDEMDYIYTTLTYFAEYGNTPNKNQFIKTIKTELANIDEEKIMTIADQFRAEGYTRGIQKGLTKGIQKGKLEVAKKLLKIYIPIEQIANATELSVRKILELKKDKKLKT
jgi:predicted transposase/invertase (TIGR01784 family)